MEKLTVTSNFQKSVESLRNTECSQKEKLQHFRQISECLVSPSMTSSEHYGKHFSSGICVLVFFCEDLDSVVRMRAEENLNKIVRSAENTRLSRVLLDLYNEIKKNGNQKSLRICLNLFAYYCPRMKEKTVKWYALKLLPCLQAISQRKEPLLHETLTEFVKCFSEHLQMCLNDNETMKLLEFFLSDIISDCTVKRRCSAQSCVYLIQRSRNADAVAKQALNKALDYLQHGDLSTSTITGVLGFLRLLLPIIISSSKCDHKQTIEIFDLCLHLLNNCNHSIINASLEVINAILSSLSPDLKDTLIGSDIHKNDFLKKRKSLKNQIFQLKNAEMTCSASPSGSSTMVSSSVIPDRDKDGGGEDGLALNQQQVHALGKSSTETIKDAFKSGSGNGKRADEQFTSEARRRQQHETTKNAGQDSISSSSTNEIRINDESTITGGVSSTPSKFCKVTLSIVDNAMSDSLSSSSTNANKMTSAAASTIVPVPQINEPHEDDVDEGHLYCNEDKSQILSDVDNESFNSIDFESEITIGIGNDGTDYELKEAKVDREGATKKSRTKDKEKDDGKADTKSTKSTDSIGAFFNNLLSHSNTETMTKLFRPSTKLSTTTTTDHTPASPSPSSSSSLSASRVKAKQTSDTEGMDFKFQPTMKYTTATTTTMSKTLLARGNVGGGGEANAGIATLTFEDDTISLESINSHISLSSHVSQQSRNEQDLVLAPGNDSEIERKSDRAVWYEVVESSWIDPEREPQKPLKQKHANEISRCVASAHSVLLQSPRKGDISDVGSVNAFDDAACGQLNIGRIYEQNIIHYTVRLIASRFLLSGTPGGLFNDTEVRVSIKSLSLAVVANCVDLKPDVLLLPLEFDQAEIVSVDMSPETSNENSSGSFSTQDIYLGLPTDDMKNEKSIQEIPIEEALLEIKDDHFGECSYSYLFDSPLSKSADQALLAPLKSFADENKVRDATRSKLNQQLEQILSKSEIIESQSYTKQSTKLHPLAQTTLQMQSTKSADIGNVVPLNKPPLFVESNAKRNVKKDAKERKQSRSMDYEKLEGNKMGPFTTKATDRVNPAATPSSSTIAVDSIELQYHHSHQGPEEWQYNHGDGDERQFIRDIFLYCNHTDPVLRGNMQIIACNFAKACLSDSSGSGLNKQVNMAMQTERDVNTGLSINSMLSILIKGFQDDIHTVVIQALTFFDKIYSLAMTNYYAEIKSIQLCQRKPDCAERLDLNDDGTTSAEMLFDEDPELVVQMASRITPKLLLDQLQLCFSNRYWLVQNKYASVISNFDYDAIREYYDDDDIAVTYEDIFLQQLLQLLGDDDVRVRDHVAVCLCDYIQPKVILTMAQMKGSNEFDRQLLEEFHMQRVFRRMSKSLCEVLKVGRSISVNGRSLLSRILFLLTNKIMDLDKKNMQMGIINAIRVLLEEFKPVDNLEIWNEFNLLDICLCFMLQNFSATLDIHTQINLIEINTKLLSANLLTGRNVQSSQLIDNLFDHALKILSIYYYLFTNQKPPMLSAKSQKADLLFTNTKDSAAHHGEEQNSDFIYVKLYGVLKTTYDNFKITINQESGNKLMSLLASCLSTLSTLLEFKPTISAPNSSVKLIEEILQYLTVIVNYSPIETINCLRQLLKFLFCRNYGNRKVEYENFLKLYFTVRNGSGRDDGRPSRSPSKVQVDGVTVGGMPGASTGVESGNRSSPFKYQLKRPDESGKVEMDAEKDLVGNGDGFNLSELFASAISFPLGKSKLEEDSARHIKLFEPLVIYCLTLFMKSNAIVQATILDMLSVLLEYNVTYSILDSKNIIFEQVESNIEMIENGTVRNSSLLIRSIIRFLIKLSKQCDRKLISMPKVISIVNNLFTNKTLRDSSVIALKEIAYELFFKRPKRTIYGVDRSLKMKELNAEREVIVRMLEQYINSIECQKMLATLLLWAQTEEKKTMSTDDSSIHSVPVMEAGTTTDPISTPTSPCADSVHQQQTTIVQERAILSIVIGALQNETIAVNNCETYFLLDAIFRNCDKSILLTNDLFESLLALFIGKHVGNFNNLSHVVIILDNVILKTEQIYLSNHVKLLFLKNAIGANLNKNAPPLVESKDELSTTNIVHDGSEQEHNAKILASRKRMESHVEWECGGGGGGTPSGHVDDEINYFVEVLYAMLETCFSTSIARPHDTDYSYLTSKYIRSVVEASMKFEKIRRSLRTLLTYNNAIYEKLEISSQNHEQVQVDILILLCELCLGRDEGDGSSSASSSDYLRTLQPRSILQYTQKIKKTNGQKAILNRVCEKFNHINWWMTEDIKVLISSELLPAFLNVETNLRHELAQHPTYSRVLMEQLLLLPTIYYKTILPSILDLISKINLNSSLLKLKFLWRLFNGDESTSSMLNRSSELLIQSHFNNEVQSLKSRLQRGDCKEYCSRNNDAIDILREISTSDNGRHLNKLSLSTQNTLERLLRLFTNGGLLKDDDVTSTLSSGYERLDDRKVGEFQEDINEKWLMQQVVSISSQSDPKALAKVLMDFKSEIKLKTIFNAEKFCPKNILGPCLDISFHAMITSFRNNCVQYNPHINYMNVNPLLRVTLQAYLQNLENVIEHDAGNESDLVQLSAPTLALMNNLHKLENISLLYIQIAAIEKFVRDRLLKSQIPIEKLLIEYITRVARHAKQHFSCHQGSVEPQMQIHMQCLDAILKQKFVWMEINQPQKYEKHLNVILDMLHEGMVNSIPYSINHKLSGLQCQEEQPLCFGAAAAVPTTTKRDSHARGNGRMQGNAINDDNKDDSNDGTDSDNQSFRMRKVIFLAKLIEFSMDGNDDKIYAKFIHSRQLMKSLTSIAISLPRTNFYYGLAVVPYELLQTLNYGKELSSYAKLPSIPVDSLSDLDTLLKFIKRLTIFGFSTRQQFEEYFMTFLLLINRVYDVNMVDEQEQFLIKNACLTVIMELLIMCKTFPFVGNRESQFHHSPRWQRIRSRNDISLKKLHKIQLIIPGTNVFYHPNLERDLSVICHDSIIGTNYFLPNQYELNHVWQQMEPLASEGINIGSVGVSPSSSTPGPGGGNQMARDGSNSGLGEFDEIKEDTSGIDLKSSCQLIFDVFTQIIEQNHILVLPNLVNFCEICDNREHIRWIKNTVSRLQEHIPFDDTISHHYIIYLLCRTQSILVPSFTELSHLCSIISTYLKSTHIFIRNATLHGLLCLLECCSKTSTTLGKLSEELCLLREIILGYITRHGIVEESSTVFSDTHTKLVWTLNFSLIEMTTKFVPECHLLSNTIISANNLLKRTTNESIYLCIVHGLERIMVVNTPQKPFCDKVEKLALELVKLENERFSLPALKLLLSCVYMGSSKQLETTEHSNGIVQDDPEIIAQQTEKVDVLLHRIKSSTSTAARIYGEVLCQIVRDLVPANEILTKVIKEFLAINQPHCEVIARIVYQVFRSCIDSSFLRLLQDWLICSLPNFLTLPPENGVWCLTVIFLSSSINLDLIKLFPFALNNTKVVDDIKTLLFIISARDFYVKLNTEQKTRFRDIFKDCELDIYIDMLKCL